MSNIISSLYNSIDNIKSVFSKLFYDQEKKSLNSISTSLDLAKFKSEIGVLSSTGNKASIPDGVYEALAILVNESLSDSFIEKYDTNPIELVKQIAGEIKGGLKYLEGVEGSVTVDNITYTFKSYVPGFNGLASAFSFVSWKNNTAQLTWTYGTESGYNALANYCSKLAQLNSDLWKEFSAYYIKELGVSSQLSKNIVKITDKLIQAICDKDKAHDLLQEIGGIVLDKLDGNKLENFVINYFNNGADIVAKANEIFKLDKIYDAIKPYEEILTGIETTTSKVKEYIDKLSSAITKCKEIEELLGIKLTSFDIPTVQSLNEKYHFNYKNESIDGVLYVYGTATSTTINDGGYQYIYSGGSAIYTTIIIDSGNHYIYYGGAQYIYYGGSAISTTINYSGHQYVSSGGSAIYTTINDGGKQYVSSGGSAIYTTINNWGYQYVSSGGSAISTTINNLGFQYIYSGGSAISDTINKGGYQIVSSGGSAISATINNYGDQSVYSGGSAIYTTINNWGDQYVSSGGSAISATINDYGDQSVYSGGSAIYTTINKGGKQYVSSGGSAIYTTINNGGIQYIYSYGTVVSSIVKKGGTISFSGCVKKPLKDCSFYDGSIIELQNNNNLSNLNIPSFNFNFNIIGINNKIEKLNTNKSTKVTYKISDIKTDKLTLSSISKSNITTGSFFVMTAKNQRPGKYLLSKNIVQANKYKYTIYAANKKLGIAHLNGIGLLTTNNIYTLNRDNNNVTGIKISSLGKIIKGYNKKANIKGTNNSDIFLTKKGNETISSINGYDVIIYDTNAWGKDVISKTSGNLTILFKNLKSKDVVRKINGTTITITKKQNKNQSITIKGWNNNTHNIVFTNGMTALDKYIKATRPSIAQTTNARNEVFKKAGIAQA